MQLKEDTIMKRKMVQRLMALGLASAMVVGMVGCGDSKGKENNTDTGKVDWEFTSEEKKLEGEFELQIFVGGYGSECWEYAIEKFQEENPDLEITAHLDANVNTQMKTRWAKDNPPDFVFLDGTDLPAETWMAEGKLMDLSEIYNKGNVYGTDVLIKDRIREGLVDTYKDTTAVYKMPFLLSTYGMWYDETLFTQKSWQVPKNYEELKTFCEASKGAGINPIIYTGQYSGYLVWGLLMPAVASEALASNDLDYFYDVANAANEEVFADQRFVRCLEKLEELAKAGYFDKSGLSMNHITSQATWLKRTDALIPNGLWLENEMKDSTPDDFQMRYYPSMLQDKDQKTCVIASASTVGIASKAKNPEAAAAFLSFLYTDEIAAKFVELCSTPSVTNVDVSNMNISDSAKQVTEMMNSDIVTMVSKGSTSWGSVDGTVNDCVNRIVSGEYTVDQAVKAIQQATAKKNQ